MTGIITPAAAGGTFKQMPFTFVFNGTFTSLYNLFNEIDGFAQRNTAGDLAVSGRLLTVQSVKLAPSTSTSASTASGKSSTEQLSGTISATAYVLPAGQTLTGGATPSGPASATAPASSSSAGASTGPAPAVVEATP